MKNYNRIFVIILFAAISVIGCAQEKEKTMTVTELKKEMTSDKDLVVLDVRTPAELTGPLGKIDGVINIPVQELQQRMDELEKYKDKKIAVICRSGNRSHTATQILTEHGYDATNVLGGMNDYRQKGF